MTPQLESRKPVARSTRGVVLLAALAMVIVVGALAAALFATAHAEMQQAQTTRATVDVRNLAEGATVAAEQSLLVAVANTLPPPAAGTLQLGPHAVPWTLAHVGNDSTDTDPTGIRTIHEHYQIDARADVGRFGHTVHRMLDVGLTPIFQYAIFYERDLELLPGPSMTISGRVHTNQDLYVGTGTGSVLQVKSDYFRAVGDIIRKRKDDGTLSLGDVRIQRSGSSLLYDLWSQPQLSGKGVPSASGYDSFFKGFDANADGDLSDAGDWADFTIGALTNWNGTVQDSSHQVKRVEPPSVGAIDRFEVIGPKQGDYSWDAVAKDYKYVGANQGDARKGTFHANADLVIRDLKAYDKSGNLLSLPSGTLTTKTFYDAREGKNVTVTELDMSKLNSSIYFPMNGLIYASRSDATASQPNGVRIKNGATLNAALTVVTEDPLYVWGDYNTVAKKPAAVIADAVNLLSNKWDDKKTKGSLPGAKPTTFNAAMITGADETIGSQYSGGFENLPRFHENWTGVNCSILGSFVKIYASRLATGDWVYGSDRYTAPNRLWDYDTSFNNAANLPPFTPNVVQVRSAAWWE